MKKIFILLASVVLFAACQQLEYAPQGFTNYETFQARIESPSTKVYADENLMVLWHADDRIKIFNKYSYGYEYAFKGETGANAGSFERVTSEGGFVTGNELPYIYAIYPYSQEASISNNGVINITLPPLQAYAEKSFGKGANTMVSVSDDNNLLFKNVSGYLILKVFGARDDIQVKSISLKGNNGEKIAGSATVSMEKGGTPIVSMSSDASEEVTIVCDNAVSLGTSSSNYTEFWFSLPPVTFSNGFTITVTDSNGGTFTQSTDKSYSIERNHVMRMEPVEVNTEIVEQNSVITYTATEQLSFSTDAFDADILSHEFSNGTGKIVFDGLLKSIGNSAFYNCKSLTTVKLPDGLKDIRSSAFLNCSSLKSIVIPDEVTRIDFGAFEGCSSLETFESNYSSVDGRCLVIDGCLVAFAPSGLSFYSVPEGVTSIGSGVFSRCSSLISITIPESVTSIYGDAFFYCSSLTSINIPDGVTFLGSITFEGCNNLTSVTIPKVENNYGFSFKYCNSLTSITIPEGVQRLGSYAFSGCSNLSSITIPESVTKIGSYAFYGCNKLNSIRIPGNVKGIEAGTFYDCSSLTSIELPQNIKYIDSRAFWECSSLSSIAIPESTERIGDQAFYNCTSLTSITIPGSVESIERVFMNCSSLSSVTIYPGVKKIGGAFINCTSLTSITIPGSVESIGSNAFDGCSSLTSVIIPEEVTSIEYKAFSNCRKLTSVILPHKLKSIGEQAFYFCDSLFILTIPESVTNIGKLAFFVCSNLSSITILTSDVPQGSDGMFSVTNDCPIFVPSDSVEAYKTADYWEEYADRITAISSN